MIEEFGRWIEEYGYVAVFIYSLGGGMVGLVAGAVAASFQKLNIIILILVAGSANFGNSLILYYFTKLNRVEIKAYLRSHRRKLAFTHLMFKKYGDFVIFIQKFIHLIRTLGIMAIALTKYPQKRFLLLSFFASYFWAISVGLLAFFLTELFIRLFENIQEYWYVLPTILLVMIYIIFKFSSKKGSKV